MRIERKTFFKHYREGLYPTGGLQQESVDALEGILRHIEEDGLEFYGTLEAIAYCLGTWRHESGQLKSGKRIEFVPVKERRANPQTQAKLYRSQARYWGYQGRGIVQLTWKENYVKLGDYLAKQGKAISGESLVATPDLLLDPSLSYYVAAYGMRDGLFRPPHKLSRYFKPGKAPDYYNARNIVNGGLDKAQEIANYARVFESALRASVSEEQALAGEGDFPTPGMPYKSASPRLDGGALPTPGLPPGEDKATGETSLSPQAPPMPDIPSTTAQPTRLKGWYAAIAGFVATNSAAFIAKLSGMPPVVLAALIISGGLVTAALIISVIWLKNKREGRANAKDIALIEASRKS